FRTFKPYPPIAPKAPRFGHTIQRHRGPLRPGKPYMKRAGAVRRCFRAGAVQDYGREDQSEVAAAKPACHRGTRSGAPSGFLLRDGPDSEADPSAGRRCGDRWNEAAPCNIALMRQAQVVKRGVAAVGATPRE